MTINRFGGIYRFLSNFHPCKVTLDGAEYSSVEYAYQAAKTVNPKEREIFQSWSMIPAGEAKRAGQRVTLRPDWNEIKLAVMLDLLRQKFSGGDLIRRLLSTDHEELVEGNWWGDTYWGVCNGKGENHLGKLLMLIRSELQEVEGQ